MGVCVRVEFGRVLYLNFLGREKGGKVMGESGGAV